jgi:hypothetical protein
MGIIYAPGKIHWAFFIALEQDIEIAARYVEPQPNNYKTFSLEICRILFAACSECEVVLKEIAALRGIDPRGFDIEDLRKEITAHTSDLIKERVFVPRYGLSLGPWENWRGTTPGSPDWWKDYNKVKHQRANFFERGNLKNALNAAAALMIAVVYYYRLELSKESGKEVEFSEVTGRLIPESRVFRLDEGRYHKLIAIG